MKTPIKVLLVLVFLLVTVFASSHNLKQITNRDGLSNSSVICLFQDSDRFLWIGTYDGLNMYDGKEIHVYKPHVGNQKSLSGNVIKNILETRGDNLWVSTKWGLNRLSRKKNTVEESYGEFRDNYYIAKDSHDRLFVLAKKGVLSYYDEKGKRFRDLPLSENISNQYIHNFMIDRQDTIWITHNGAVKKFTVDFKNPHAPVVVRHPNLLHAEEVTHANYDKGRFVFLDIQKNLYVVQQGRKKFIANITPITNENGIISTMIFDGDDILIGFKTNGLVRLIADKGYRAEKTDINCGVFSLWKDEQQDIIWIGTDGQGVFAYTKEAYSFANVTLDQLPIKRKRPVRALQTDKEDNLWLGTKDNGIIRVKNYRTATDYSAANVIQYTTKDGLANNSVFAFSLSRRNLMWIGSDGPGLCYYSYDDQRIHTVASPSRAIRYVHTLYESSDSVLWMGADEEGLLKVSLRGTGNRVEVAESKSFRFGVEGKRPGCQIYSIHAENDSILWLGTRGYGVIRFNRLNETFHMLSFNQSGIPPVDDILCIHQDKDERLWFGSSYGLIRLDSYRDGQVAFTNYTESNGLPNNTIHGMHEDRRGNFWLSSNTGIIQFNPQSEVFRQYNYKTGLDVFEFSDNAYYQSPFTGAIFFGGVNGIVRIDEDVERENTFVPRIFFTRLRIFNENFSLHELMKDDCLELAHDQNFFAISFVAMDFINGANSSYSYMLENFSNVWMDTEGTNEARFTNIPPGKYVLKVRYNSGMDGSKDQLESITIVILPPWYQTVYAQVGYVLLLFVGGWYVTGFIRRRHAKRRKVTAEKLEERHRGEVYEEKLRFFTNITHEFCTPLTLIYGPCERILAHENTDSFIRKYIQLIKSNAERLNGLIQEVIEFRRMETGHKMCRIEQVQIDEVLNDISTSFSDLAEQNRVRFAVELEEPVAWNTDIPCLTKILNNLVSNAFKYTPVGGIVRIRGAVADGQLVLRVYNTGKGIRHESMGLIFNRYSILENIEENAVKGLSSRNGLGMAICHSMVELLHGDIKIESRVNEYAEFIVSLPLLELTPFAEATPKKQLPTPVAVATESKQEQQSVQQDDQFIPAEAKAKVLVIDDNREILELIREILSDKYRVLTAGDGNQGLEVLKKEVPDLVITDIMMPGTDGIELTRQIKQNQHTMYIPLVILSAKNTNEEKVEGLESGADAYIPKPFNTNYLRAVVDRLLESRVKLKEYYNSSASAYEFANGQLLQREDKDFMQTVMRFVDENMDNADVTPEDMANYMQISIRNLYRRFKELDQVPPKDFIKDCRIGYAAKLLKTTTLTIQEIIYRTGFNNRSHFYKEFDKRFSITPKEYREANKQRDNTLG